MRIYQYVHTPPCKLSSVFTHTIVSVPKTTINASLLNCIRTAAMCGNPKKQSFPLKSVSTRKRATFNRYNHSGLYDLMCSHKRISWGGGSQIDFLYRTRLCRSSYRTYCIIISQLHFPVIEHV